MDEFIIIRSESDLPKDIYSNDFKIYLCVTISGKVVVCKYIKNEGTIKYRWENAAVWRDSLGEVIAYREIHVSRDVLDVLDSCKSQKVEYYKSLE